MTNRDGFKSGVSRQQPSFLPARIEDYVDRNNPVGAASRTYKSTHSSTVCRWNKRSIVHHAK